MDDLAYDFVLPHEGPELAKAPFPTVDPPVNKQAPAEYAENDDQPNSHTRYSETYPRSAGQPLHKEKTQFEKFHDNNSVAKGQPWEPFSSKKEWELATWLMKNVNQKATEQYLNLPMVSSMFYYGTQCGSNSQDDRSRTTATSHSTTPTLFEEGGPASYRP
jgi:hypothetical protein